LKKEADGQLPRTEVRGLQLEGLLIRSVASGPVDCDPACGDHERGIDIRVRDDAAGCAGECFSISDTPLEALMAGLGRIGRVNLNDPDPLYRRLVPDECLKLGEAPERNHPIEMLGGDAKPTPDPLQILKGDDGTSRPDGLLNDGLGDDVVEVFGSAGLPARETPENALGVPGSVALEARTNPQPLFAVLADQVSIEFPPRGRDSHVSYSQIDAQNLVAADVFDFFVNADVEEEAFLGSDQSSRRGRLSTKGFPLVIPDVEDRLDPSIVAGKGYDTLVELEGERVPVNGDERGTNFEFSFEPCGLEHSAGSSESGYDKIGLKPILLPDRPVKRVVETDCVGLPMVPAPLGDLGDGLGVAGEEFVQSGDVVWINGELALDCSDRLHDRIVFWISGKSREMRLLPGLKSGVPAA